MRRTIFLAGLVLLFLASPAAAGELMKCRMKYDLKGWSVLYKTSKGTGHIKCDNGQAASVNIRTEGGGLTVGKSEVIGGKGTFSGVRDISELYGGYAEATAHAGMGESTDSRVMTKGEVSLALSGTGQGANVGVAFGAFIIERK
jgi:hypothetical protein